MNVFFFFSEREEGQFEPGNIFKILLSYLLGTVQELAGSGRRGVGEGGINGKKMVENKTRLHTFLLPGPVGLFQLIIWVIFFMGNEVQSFQSHFAIWI